LIQGRILVVEDEGLVAMAIGEILRAAGYDVVGPAPTAAKALKLIETEPMDAALLDVNLRGERTDKVAQVLADASIPFVFSTGYSSKSALPPSFADHEALRKPFLAEDMLKAIRQLLAQSVNQGQACRDCRSA
jgi:CheY-like chemotaxis protein